MNTHRSAVIRKCSVCGDQFRTSNSTHRRCPDCRDANLQIGSTPVAVDVFIENHQQPSREDFVLVSN